MERLFEKYNRDVKHIRRVRYRFDGMGYLGEKRSQVFVLDLAVALDVVPGEFADLHQVTTGDFDHSNAAWSPDGSRLAVTACRAEDADLQRFSDLWVFSVDGKEEPQKLTVSTGPVRAPRWSPDGAQLAYLGHARERGGHTSTRLWLVPADGSIEPRCVSESFDRSLGDRSITDMRTGGQGERPVWSPDGTQVYLPVSDHGTTHLCRVDTETGRVEQLTEGDFAVFGYDVCFEAGLAALAVAMPESPNDIFTVRLQDSVPVELHRLTSTNESLLSERHVSLPERFTYNAPGGPEVDGWVIKPVNCDHTEKYPAVLQIHGGPMAMYASTFFFEFQLLASAGIGVIFTNPRGSEGYGEDFCAAIRGQWGTYDYEDVVAGVEAALERFDWIDPDRLGAAGGSYGGFMTSWLIGHSDRFRAFVSMRAVNNMYSMFGTSDIGYLDEDTWGRGETPWQNADPYLSQSPIHHVGTASSPTLIIHSENDFRCPISQGEELFVALKKLGVETEFIRYPNESHGLSRGGQPWHRVHRLQKVVDWFERWL